MSRRARSGQVPGPDRTALLRWGAATVDSAG
ncbi:hypothetical protein HNQ79_004389 [Streptomyces candidus]|uniref:Uncharacterized protein n=1 Tax=Streptomyces candidus TaxID=67283 RepID=A0A7X0HHX9_9ACTN|nr:hypothetical protein [Streptomyces candidus]